MGGNFKMLKKFFKILSIESFLFLSFIFIGVGSSCQSNYKYWSNGIDSFDSFKIYDLFLNKGESQIIDFKQQLEDTNLSITKLIINSKNEDVCTVKENAITATGMGKTSIEAKIYCKNEKTCYLAQLANVYVVDPTHKDLIEIYKAQDLVKMNQNKNGWYILKNDIDLKSYENWEPVGNLPTEQNERNAFQGIIINPKGYKIKNLTIQSSKTIPHGKYGGCNGGLFGNLDGAYIDGIILENVNINLSDFDGELASCAGGIAAQEIRSVIRNCKVEGTIISQDRCGGVIGGSSYGKLIGCTFKGNVQSINHAAGGIAGFGYIIKDCQVEGNIKGAFASGGILGFKTVTYYMKNCSFSGELLGNGYKGNLIGYTFD